MLPRMLLVCVTATSFVRSESRGCRVGMSKVGFVFEGGVHHFTFSWRHFAAWSQAATFASWSSFERIISSPGCRWSCSAVERLRKSWVVDGPITGTG